MPTRNYNTTLKTPYIRAEQLVINYGTSEAELVKISITENQAIIDNAGKTYILQGLTNSLSKTLSATDLATESFKLINPATGEETVNSMTTKDLQVALVSYVRKIQKEANPS